MQGKLSWREDWCGLAYLGRRLPWGRSCLMTRVPATLPLTCVLLIARVGPSLVRGLLAVSLAVNALFTSAYLYQSLR